MGIPCGGRKFASLNPRDGSARERGPTAQLGAIEKAWGRRDLNPDRRVSPTRGATHACSANHGAALQSVITGISKPVRPQAHDWSPEFYQAKLRPHGTCR